MYKNQLQELAQRSCFNLPSYACVREGPDHAPRFKACVNFNGEIFEGPSHCTTLRQAEHAAAEVALTNLSNRWHSRSLAARVLDETGVYKNLLQETAHRAGLQLPVYTAVRSGPGHQPIFTCTVELAGMSFAGEPAKTKKQAEKNAAMSAWSALKQMPSLDCLLPQAEGSEDQEQVVVARVLSSFRSKEENRPTKPRDQQQRRRPMLGSSSSSSSPHSSNWYGPQWRSQQSPTSSDGFTPFSAHLQQKQSSWLALPPPQGPKILTPLPFLQQTTSVTASDQDSKDMSSSINPSSVQSKMSIPVQLRNRSQVSIQEIPLPMDDDKELINERSSDVKGKATEKGDREWINAKIYTRANQQQISAGLISRVPEPRTPPAQFCSRPFSPPPRIRHPPINSRTIMPIPRMMAGGGGYRAPGIAPAVHIRSVIPVCAAPSPARPTANTPTHKKEPEEEISGKFNKLQL